MEISLWTVKCSVERPGPLPDPCVPSQLLIIGGAFVDHGDLKAKMVAPSSIGNVLFNIHRFALWTIIMVDPMIDMDDAFFDYYLHSRGKLKLLIWEI